MHQLLIVLMMLLQRQLVNLKIAAKKRDRWRWCEGGKRLIIVFYRPVCQCREKNQEKETAGR